MNSLDPELLGDVLEHIRRVGRATDRLEAAESLTGRLQIRIDAVTERAAQGERPRESTVLKCSNSSGLIPCCAVVTGWWKWWKELAVKVVLAARKRGRRVWTGIR